MHEVKEKLCNAHMSIKKKRVTPCKRRVIPSHTLFSKETKPVAGVK